MATAHAYGERRPHTARHAVLWSRRLWQDGYGHCLRVTSARQQSVAENWNHPDLHFSYPTIKKPSMGSEHQPVSADYTQEWLNMLNNGPYFTMEQWMDEMGAENQQAIITGAESDAISHDLNLKASQGGYKVSIIWLPERMNLASANKILKILEEPPQNTVFLMVSEEPEKLLETIRSRTQRFTMKGIDTADIEQTLITNEASMPRLHTTLRVWQTATGTKPSTRSAQATRTTCSSSSSPCSCAWPTRAR